MITEIVGLKDSPSESIETIEARNTQIAIANDKIKSTSLSIISQDCLGGVIYHDTKSQFLSPTINLWFSASDFVKLALNLDFYLAQDLKIISQEPPVVGMLEDIKVHFAHYNSGEDAKNKWNRRKARILQNKILIMCTDRFGFGKAEFEEFKKIKYPKILVTRNELWKDYDFVVYLEQYASSRHIGTTIPLREFYHKKIFNIINKITQD